MPDNTEEFLAWEQASRDGILVKRCYIDLAGDLATGTLLSQIVYWYLPAQGKSKLRVEHEGRMWLVKKRTDWWEECRISAKQADRSLRVLKDIGVIETRLFKFKGAATLHISLNINALVEGVKRVLPKGENGILPKGKTGITERVKPLTETTNIDYLQETTTGVSAAAAATPSSEQKTESLPDKARELTGETISSPEKRVAPAAAPLRIQRVSSNSYLAVLQNHLGYPDRVKIDPIPNPAKEATFIAKMQHRGFSWEEIFECWRKKSEARGNTYISMVYVNEDIGKEDSNAKRERNYQQPASAEKLRRSVGKPLFGPGK